MQLNKAQYEINGIQVTIERAVGNEVKISWDDLWLDCPIEDDKVWEKATRLFHKIHDYKGTRLDVAEIHRAIMAFET